VTLVPCGPRKSLERLPHEVRRPDRSRGQRRSGRLWMVSAPSAYAAGAQPMRKSPGRTRVPRWFPTAKGATIAVTIDAPPDQVWPWLVQMGVDRGDSTRPSPTPKAYGGFPLNELPGGRTGLVIGGYEAIRPRWLGRVYSFSRLSGLYTHACWPYSSGILKQPGATERGPF
jgi:hypothetical protein